MRGGGEKIALADDSACEVALGEAERIAPGEHAVISKIRDVEDRRGGGGVDGDGLRAVELTALHQIGRGGGEKPLLQDGLSGDSRGNWIEYGLRF